MITTDTDGRENIYPNEPPIQLLPKQKLMSPEAERFNGWAAMLGFVAAMNDKRYDRDPAYRQDIIEKLDRSNLDF